MAVMFIDEPDHPLRYMPIPLDELYFLERYDETIDCVFREHRMTARQIMSRFEACPDRVTEASPQTKFTLLESVIPNGSRFDYCVHLRRDWSCLIEDRMPLNPFVVCRWEKIIGSSWGNSPTRTAVAATRSVQQIVQDTLTYGSFAANGL